MFAIVILGPPGVGKTSTLAALENQLTDRRVRHAAVETEALAWAYPPLPDAVAFRHLSAMRELYADAGYDLILCGATVTSAGYMSGLLDALRPTARLLVRLDAGELTLRERIKRREPPEWSGLADLLTAAGVIAAESRKLPADAVYSTDELPPQEIAARVTCEMLARQDVAPWSA